MKKIILSILLMFFLTGCSIIPSYRIYNKNKIDNQLQTLQIQTAKQLSDNQLKIEQKYTEIISDMNVNSQKANTFIYGIVSTEELKPNKDRFDDVIEFKAKAAFSLLPPPTPEQLLQENTDIKKELDTTKTSLVDLQNKYAQIDKDNQLKQTQLAAANSDLIKIQQDKTAIFESSKSQEHDLQEARNKANNLDLAKKDNDLKSAKSDKDRRDKLTYAFAGIGVIIILLGILVLKSPLTSMIGGGFVAFSLFVGTAPDYVLWGIPLLLILAGIGDLVYKYISEKGLGDNLVRSIERFKTSSVDEYNKLLKPILANENGKYDANGNVIPDPKVDAQIDQKLVDMKLK